MTPPRAAMPGRPTGRWAVWRFNWLANHRLMSVIERARHHARGELLDIGCGSRPFATLFAGRVTHYWGTDLSRSIHYWGAGPDAFAAAGAQPFRSGSMDTVVSFSVVNYLRDPSELAREAARVLRPGGIALIEFPQMEPILEPPNDYWRFTRYGAALLLEPAGLEPIEVLPLGGLWIRIGLSAIGALNRINRGPTRILTEIPVRLLYVAIQLCCEVLDRLFHDPLEPMSNMIVARKPGADSIRANS